MSTAAQRSFVAGATGYTGGALIQHADGAVYAHMRPGSRSEASLRARAANLPRVEVVSAAWRSEALKAALVGVDVVYACLGTTTKRGRSEAGANYETVDYGLSAWLLKACAELSPPPRFVYLSAVGSESGRGAYRAARKRLEDELRASGVPYTIVRPSFISGDREEHRPIESASANALDAALGVLAFFGATSFAAKYRSMTGDTLARGMVQLAREDAARGV
ncbi:MAG: NAD(P)H-binding protein, partial [Myxococcota bacterium]